MAANPHPPHQFPKGHKFGGARPGSGPPTKEVTAMRQIVRDKAIRRINAAADKIINTYLKLASGPHPHPPAVLHAMEWILGELAQSNDRRPVAVQIIIEGGGGVVQDHVGSSDPSATPGRSIVAVEGAPDSGAVCIGD